MEVLYTAHASATGGRHGKAATSDGRLQVSLTPPTMPNRPEHGTDPEQLFACGYAACFGGATEFAAKQLSIELTAPVQVDSSVSLLKRPEGGFIIGVDLVVHLQGVDEEQGKIVVEKAHTICPYSNATRGNITVNTTVVAVPAVA
ncbi:MAG: organic hydroperoxide resistance protein [Pseudomonas fluorescens]|nr:MAG: organic hydroperoxide resistance protein [Pseudomonas fluorescens]